ncbi:MAG: hypothetical protein HYT94_01370 [Parcubacteria group bacterium]|nr:hypothetical protein [Parcubacteria group bacterium]
MKNCFLWFFVLFISSFFAAQSAFAGTGLTIQPIKVSHTLNPGEEAHGFISLTNASNDDSDTKITLKVEDFLPFAGNEGVNFVGRAPGVTTAMDWISLGENNEHEFLIKKGEAQRIPYVIRAPLDAEPGGHYGVLFFKATRTGEGETLNIGTQVGVLVLITVPGNHLQKGQILDFLTSKKFYQKAPIDFSIRFENTGTVHFEPKGTITITNIFGKEIGEVPVQGQIVLPTGIRNLTAKWDVEGLLLGKYTAALSIVDGEGAELTAKSVSFYVFPVWYISEFFGAVILAYLALRYMRRKVKINISFK